MWFKHEEFDIFVKEEWKKLVVGGRGDYCLVEKLKTLKNRLAWWNKSVYGWIDIKINSDGREMHALDNLFVHFAGNVPDDVVAKRLKVAEDFWDNINKREGILRLKSRQLWLSEGDDNTRYFHNSLKDRRRRNAICSIDSPEGRLEGVEEVKEFTFKHFEKFFKEDCLSRPELRGINFNSLSYEDSSGLEKPFEEDEVKEAIYSCDGNKSPGSDGFSLEFYKRNWSIIKEDFMKCCNDLYHKGTLVKSITSSFLALIPKKKNPQDLFEYRPICLVGSIYKIIAKMLAANQKLRFNQKLVCSCNGRIDRFNQKLRGGEPTYDNLWSLKVLLRGFELVSGLKINFHKSNLYGTDIGDWFLNLATTFLACKKGCFPFKFLGIWVGEGANKKKVWQEVIDNLKSRLSECKGRNISIGGRVTLIGSVLNAIPIFTLSFYKGPSKIIQDIRSLLSNFLWCGNTKSRCIHWVKWENVCKPKEKGGLGIRDVGEMNKALLLKWKWRILKEDKAIWSRFLLLRYQDPKTKVLASSKDLLSGDDSRRNILFWHNCWVDDHPLRVTFPLLFARTTNNLCTVSDLFTFNQGEFTWKLEDIFDTDALNPSVPIASTYSTSASASNIGDELRDLRLILQRMEPDILALDDYHWKLTSNGFFTVSSVSHLVSNAKELAWPTSTTKLLDVIWKNKIPEKIKIFAWRFFINRLPLKDQLAIRGVPNLSSIDCLFCSNNPETLEHLFFHCHATKEVWSRIHRWLGNDLKLTLEEFKNFGSIQEKVKNTNIKVTLNSIWIALIWCTWNMRNTMIFDGGVFSFDEVISNIMFFSWRWASNKELPSRINFYDWYKLPLLCNITL
ncbi:uncharacterized protein LOC131604946 [Vicia villosa]|uniref:uncharacterized protein LOC131604946 n=1 Tax=Vicia villosa TaxID=3911 RepID=UPI00273C72CC|nr:uncharacterized protein LOC131604946 [Vicia villosa]